jgi:hypothetical protein
MTHDEIEEKMTELLELVYAEGYITAKNKGLISVKNTRGRYLDEFKSLLAEFAEEVITKNQKYKEEWNDEQMESIIAIRNILRNQQRSKVKELLGK